MAARLDFIIGAAGSGKSGELMRRLVSVQNSGGGGWLVVPEQSAVAAETRLAELLEGSDSSRLEVVNFTRLCNLVFRRLGGLAYNYADAGARTAAMWRTLDELSGMFSHYKIAPEESRRWAQLFLDEYTRQKARGITPAVLLGEAKRLPQGQERLAAKLSDLALAGASYSRLLCELYDDPSDDTARAAELIRGSGFFAGGEIWIDAFDGFTREQYMLIREMLRSAERVTVTLCMRPGTRAPAFDTVRQTELSLRRLAGDAGCEIGSPTVMKGFPRYASSQLARISASLWDEEEFYTEDGTDENTQANLSGGNFIFSGQDGTPARDKSAPDNLGGTASGGSSAQNNDIRIVECADRFEEAELAAAEIVRYVQRGGRWRDCAVIARNISSYDGIIDAALELAGAPYFMSRRTDVSSRPVVKLAMASLAVISGGWRRTDIMEMLRTGMMGISPVECDVLEEYIAAWSISGEGRWTSEYEWRMNPDGYTDTLSPRGEAILKTVNRVREKIVPPLSRLADSFIRNDKSGYQRKKHLKNQNDGVMANDNICRADELSGRSIAFDGSFEEDECGNVKSAAAGLYAFLCELGVPEQLEEKEGELAHLLWEALTGALDTIVTVAGSAKINADRFAQIFGTVIRQASVGRIPASVDCVTVGQSDRMRAEGVKLAILLGASEGVFPGKTDTGYNIFTGSELRTLRDSGIDICDDEEYTASAELFGFYRAAASPSERLVITFSPSVKGIESRPAIPSPGIKRLLAMFTWLKIELFSEIDCAERVWSFEKALEIAVSRRDTAEGEALRRIFASNPRAAALMEAAARPLAEPDASLSPEFTAEIFRGDLALTQSRLDSYVLCSFSYYCRYMIGLRERTSAEFGGADTGNFTHRVLERFMRGAMLPDGTLNLTLDKAEREKMTDEIIADYIESAFGQGEQHSARAQNLFRRLRRTTLLVIENLTDEFSQSEFVPKRFELPIAKNEYAEDREMQSVEPLRIPLPDGGDAYVYGTIDRVDTYRRGNELYLRVVDYKTGTQRFSMSDLALGLNMQLLLYLFSLWSGGGQAVGAPPKGEVLPAGIIYMSAGAPRVNAEPGEDADETKRRASERLTRSGILIDDEEILRAMEKNLEEKYIPVSLKKSGGIKTKIPLTDIAGFGKLMRSAEKTIAAIAGEFRRGKAKADPLRDKRHDACKYCPYGAVCRSRRT